IRHAASVHPEPGSNSPFDLAPDVSDIFLSFFKNRIDVFGLYIYSVFKDRSAPSCERSFILSNSSPSVNYFFEKIH
ncbi:hypothetical protein, partial [Catenisphaera adipataccumulans]|uniref:hypothetical protein n=1 Tax=Catenisphaera adipataccumulans TaxID=700500 RepID=UPI001C86333C